MKKLIFLLLVPTFLFAQEPSQDVGAWLRDSTGTLLTSTLVGSDQSIDTNITQSALPSGAATSANQLADGHNVTANAGTNLNTSALALDVSVDGIEALLTTIDSDTGDILTEIQGQDTLVTYTHTRPSIASGSSQILINANAGRKAGSYVTNNTSIIFYISYGTAVGGQGAALFPNGTFLFNSTQALNCIQTSGGALNLDVFEAS